MKTLLLITISFFATKVYSQDKLRIDQINALVKKIHTSDFSIQRDSTSQDYPNLGVNIKTFTRLKTYGKELKEGSKMIRTTQTKNGITIKETTASIFYYDHNDLIKVEEFTKQKGYELTFDWYFSGRECFFHTLKSDNAEQRVATLLKMSDEFLAKMNVKN